MNPIPASRYVLDGDEKKKEEKAVTGEGKWDSEREEKERGGGGEDEIEKQENMLGQKEQ